MIIDYEFKINQQVGDEISCCYTGDVRVNVFGEDILFNIGINLSGFNILHILHTQIGLSRSNTNSKLEASSGSVVIENGQIYGKSYGMDELKYI